MWLALYRQLTVEWKDLRSNEIFVQYNHQNLQFSAKISHSTSMNENSPFHQNDFFSSALEIPSHTQTWIPDTLISSTDQNLGEIFWIVSNDLILENSFVSNQHTNTNETLQ